MEVLGLLLSVVVLDLILSGDNAVVVAAVANHVAPDQRTSAINLGMLGAALARVAFLCFAVVLLSFSWLAKLGGLVLIGIAIKLAVDIVRGRDEGPVLAEGKPVALWAAVTSIMLADVTLSFDNVMAVGGLAHRNAWVMVLGVVLSIALLTKAAHWIAPVLLRHRWLHWAGVGLILVAAYRLLAP